MNLIDFTQSKKKSKILIAIPKKWRKILAVFLLLCFFTNVNANLYKDVPQSHWAYEAVENLSKIGVITGFPDGTFRGNEILTRFQATVLIYRIYTIFDNKLVEVDNKIKSIEGKIVEMNTKLNDVSDKMPKVSSGTLNVSTVTKATDSANFSESLKDITNEISSLRSSLDSLSKDVKKLVSDVTNLSSKNLQIEKGLAQQESNTSALKKNIEDLIAKYSTLSDKINKFENSFLSAEKSIQSLSSKLISIEKYLNDNFKSLNEKYNSLSEKLKVLEESKIRQDTSSTYATSDSKSEIENLRKKIDDISKEIENIHKNIAQINFLKDEINQLTIKLNSVEKELKSEKDTIFSVSKSFTEHFEMILSEIQDLESTVKKINAQMEKNTAIQMEELKEYKKNFADILERVKRIDALISDLKQENKSLDEKINNLYLKMNDLNVKLEEYLQQFEQYKRKSIDISKVANPVEIVELVKDIKETILSSAELRTVIESINKMSQVESKMEDLQSRLESITKQLSVSMEDSLTVRKEISELRKNVELLNIVISELKILPVDSLNLVHIIEKLDKRNAAIDDLSVRMEELLKVISSVSNRVRDIETQFSKISQLKVESALLELEVRLKRIEDEVQRRATTAQLNAVNQNIQKVLSMVLDLGEELKKIREGMNILKEKSTEHEKVISEMVKKESSQNLQNLGNSLNLQVKPQTISEVTSFEMFNNKISELVNKIEQLALKINEVENQFEKQREKEGYNTNLMNSLTMRLEEVGKELEGIKSSPELANLLERVNQISTELKHLNEKLTIVQTNQKENAKLFNNFNELFSNIKGELKDLELKVNNNYKHAMEKININELAISSIFSELSKAINEIEGIKKEQETLKAYIQSLNYEFDNNLGKVYEMYEMLGNNLNDFQKEVHIVLNNYEERISVLESKIIFVDGTLKSVDNSFNAFVEKYNEEYLKFSVQLTQVNESVASLDKKIEKLETNNEIFNNYIANRTQMDLKVSNEVSELKAKVSELEKEKQSMQSSINLLTLITIISLAFALYAIFGGQ